MSRQTCISLMLQGVQLAKLKSYKNGKWGNLEDFGLGHAAMP